MTRPRITVRVRLTALYGVLFLAAGVTLLVVNYALVRRNLPPQIRVADPPATSPMPGAVDVFIEPAPEELERLEEAAADFREQTLEELVIQSGLALGLTAIAAIGLGWVVAGRALRPVHEITAAAQRLSERNLHERLDLEGPEDELKELADTFDAMLARLDDAFESQRRFVANASHELRTPLSIMRAEFEVAARDPGITRDELLAMTERLTAVIERTEHVVDRLLTLSRSLHGVDVHDAVDLADVAETALAELDRQIVSAGLRVDADLRSAVTRGDGGLLDHLASNLITNACRYNVAHGWIAVRTAAEARTAVLEVRNSGPMVDPGDADSLFEPFRRSGADRTASDGGAGLGLAIVRAVVRAHGGDVALRPLAEGGLAVTVHLPLTDARTPAPAGV